MVQPKYIVPQKMRKLPKNSATLYKQKKLNTKKNPWIAKIAPQKHKLAIFVFVFVPQKIIR